MNCPKSSSIRFSIFFLKTRCVHLCTQVSYSSCFRAGQFGSHDDESLLYKSSYILGSAYNKESSNSPKMSVKIWLTSTTSCSISALCSERYCDISLILFWKSPQPLYIAYNPFISSSQRVLSSSVKAQIQSLLIGLRVFSMALFIFFFQSRNSTSWASPK